jgi:anti-sigma-K factor RskA
MTLEPVALTCDEVEDLAGAYALGALLPVELRAVDEHLASCRLSDHAQVRDLTETAALLPFMVPAAAPPAALGVRIAGAATAEPRSTGAIGPQPGPAVIPLFRGGSAAAGRFAFAAAAAVLLAIGLGAWGAVQHRELIAIRQVEHRQTAIMALLASGGTILQTPSTAAVPSALLVESGNGGPVYLVQSWPVPPPGKTYQAWFVSQGKPVSAGVFGGSSGDLQAVQLAGSIGGAQAFAVTIEAAGGSAQPTTEPLFVRPLATS